MNAGIVLVDVAVKDLSGAALNWAVAQVVDYKTALEENDNGPDEWIVMGREDMYLTRDPDEFCVWSPSTDWSQGGPLIEKHAVTIAPYSVDQNGKPHFWVAEPRPDVDGSESGPTALVAACRAIVAAKLGEIVKVPHSLVMP